VHAATAKRDGESELVDLDRHDADTVAVGVGVG
jgi:hypothetical protein